MTRHLEGLGCLFQVAVAPRQVKIAISGCYMMLRPAPVAPQARVRSALTCSQGSKQPVHAPLQRANELRGGGSARLHHAEQALGALRRPRQDRHDDLCHPRALQTTQRGVVRPPALPLQQELRSHTAALVMRQCYGTVLARCTEFGSQHCDRTSGSSPALGALSAPSATGTGEGAAIGAGGAAGALARPRTRQCTLEPPKPKLEMATVPPCQGVGSATTCMPSMPLQAAFCGAGLSTR